MRLKDFILSGMILIFAVAVVACGEDKPPIVDDSWNSGSLTVNEEVTLSGTSSQQLNIKASVKPTLTSDAEWLKIGEVKSLTTGIYTVDISAEANTTGDPRTAKVIVTAGKENATITVTQASSDVVEIRSVDPQGELDPEGCTLTIKYVATAAPATNLPDWIKETGTRSLVDGELTFTVSPNDSGREREGIIVLAVGKEAVANVTVRQGAKAGAL